MYIVNKVFSTPFNYFECVLVAISFPIKSTLYHYASQQYFIGGSFKGIGTDKCA